MSVAPPPVTYTATNDLNILKNIFVPQYKFSNGYFHALVNTQLPGNVTVGGAAGSIQGGATGTDFKIFVNGAAVMTLSDLENWSFYYATSNLNMNSNSITSVSKLTFVGGNSESSYMIDATTGTINVSQYSLKNIPLTLSGGLPAWSRYPALANVVMSGKAVVGAAFLSLSAGGTITNPLPETIAFSNVYGETVRINASGALNIGTTIGYSGYSLNVSGGTMLSSPMRVVTDAAGKDSNSFFVQTVSGGGGKYDVRLGSLGGNTDLYICTGNADPAGGFSNTNQVKVDVGGNMTLLAGEFKTQDPAKLCMVGGVKLQNSRITSYLTISEVSDTTLTIAAANNSTTLILSNAGFNAITLPGTSAIRGMYWAVKNVTGSTLTVTTASGTITNLGSSFTISNNTLITIVYSGTLSNYYAL